MPTPTEVKMKKHADKLNAARLELPQKRGWYLRNKDTGVILSWSPNLAVLDHMVEVRPEELPEGYHPTTNQPTRSLSKDKYDLLEDLPDLVALAKSRGIKLDSLGAEKWADVDAQELKQALRRFDAEAEGDDDLS